LALPSDEDQLWRRLSSERRNRVRKARKAELSVELGGEEVLPVFYRIWAENMRDLGSPAHGYAFFAEILRIFSSTAKIILVKHQGQSIGAGLCLYSKGMLTLPWVSSLRKHFSLYPNNILYWEAMRFALRQGCRVFDFGRSSRDSGTYKFKTRWGAVPQPLHWQFKFFGGEESGFPATDGVKYRWAAGIWKRIPVAVSKIIGPRIRKNITA
jgi:FemAB-related protein (PEP-CTERM system-associated)